MTADESPRLLMIGLDAFPPALLDQWCDEGLLPNFAQLRVEGTRGTVQSPADLLPGAVWPTFSSRSNPGEHGIYHFMQWDGSSMRFRRPTSDWCGFEPFWYELGRHGVPVVAFDVPFTYPARPVPNVVEAHGWGLHDELAPPASQPSSLLDDLRRRHGRSPMRPDVLGPKPLGALRREIGGIVTSLRRRVDVIEALAREQPWRALIAPFAETHRAGHWYWSDRVTGVPRDGLQRVAVEIDAALPRLRALLRPEDRLFVFSLHGMGDYHDFDRFAEPFAEYLNGQHAPPARRSFDPVRIANTRLPQGVRRSISAAFPTRVRDGLLSHFLGAGHDWSQTRVIGVPPDGKLYYQVNLTGRERDGAVAPDAFDAEVERIVSAAKGLTDARGTPVTEAAERSRDHFAGARLERLPGRRRPGS